MYCSKLFIQDNDPLLSNVATEMTLGILHHLQTTYALNIGTPKAITIIRPKMEPHGFTMQKCIQKTQINGKQCRVDQTAPKGAV